MVNSGPGLVFITYPEVVLKLPGGPIWAVTFFVMLVVSYENVSTRRSVSNFLALSLQTIGIDSEFCIVESLVTGIVDMFPNYLRPRRRMFTTAVCITLFVLGVPMVTNGGAYIFQVLQNSTLQMIDLFKALLFHKGG